MCLVLGMLENQVLGSHVIKNQKYTKEQNKFICDIITNVAARELVKRKNVAHWEVNFDELQELAIDQIRDFFQKYYGTS